MNEKEITPCEDESEHESCQSLLSTLGEYGDCTLHDELCAERERHMKDCEHCQIVVNTLKKTVELYQEIAEGTDLPGEVRQRLYVRLNLDDYLK